MRQSRVDYILKLKTNLYSAIKSKESDSTKCHLVRFSCPTVVSVL